MRDAETAGAPGIPPRPEGEPHLTFSALLADTLHEMAAYEDAERQEPDAVSLLCDDAIAALRTAGSGSLSTPFHHAYLTPAGLPALPSRPARLDVRY